MDKNTAHQKRWLEAYLAPLVGATIKKVTVKVDNSMGYPEVWPVLHCERAMATALPGVKQVVKFQLEVSQDEEGNGPGFLFGLPSVYLSEEGEVTYG